MRISLRAVLIGLVAIVALGTLFGTGILSTVSSDKQQLQKIESNYCSTSGVSLVVDTGKTIPSVACAKNFAGTGWELFAATGQTVHGTSEYPSGFVCRINDFPSVSDQPCTTTPTSAEGSWAYYFATASTGNHWMFSGIGAGMRKPFCGDVDAWVYIEPGQKVREPSIAPKTFKCKN